MVCLKELNKGRDTGYQVFKGFYFVVVVVVTMLY